MQIEEISRRETAEAIKAMKADKAWEEYDIEPEMIKYLGVEEITRP